GRPQPPHRPLDDLPPESVLRHHEVAVLVPAPHRPQVVRHEVGTRPEVLHHSHVGHREAAWFLLMSTTVPAFMSSRSLFIASATGSSASFGFARASSIPIRRRSPSAMPRDAMALCRAFIVAPFIGLTPAIGFWYEP